jgi:hypothetical protein
MNFEDINEKVEILISFKHTARGNAQVMPEVMNWHGRRYRFTKLGLHYPTTQGKRMVHRFTMTTEAAFFELEFNAEELSWSLLRVSDGT